MESKPRNILGWVQVAVTVCICVLTLAAVPWIRGVNEDMSQLRVEMNSIPHRIRVSQLETEDVIRKELNVKLDVILPAVQRIEVELVKHTSKP